MLKSPLSLFAVWLDEAQETKTLKEGVLSSDL